MSYSTLWAGLAILGGILLVVWLIKRNQKDKKEFEDQFIQTEMKPEIHEEEEDEVIDPNT